MEKLLSSIRSDPWNKLNTYIALQIIAEERSELVQAQLLLNLAHARRAVDPFFAVDLCEAAIRICPQAQGIVSGCQDFLRTYRLEEKNTQTQPAAKADSREPLQHQAHIKSETETRDESFGLGANGGILNLQAKKREMVTQLRKSIETMGVPGYVTQLLMARGVSQEIANEVEGFQANWIGMIQFLDFLHAKGTLNKATLIEVGEEIEQTLFLIEPKHAALERLRKLYAEAG